MSKFVKLTVRSTGLPLVVNADLIESMIPMDGYTSIRMTGYAPGCTDHVLESVEKIEDQLLRDEFAARSMQAIQGAITIPDGDSRYDQCAYNSCIAKHAYEMADAMIKERRE